MEHPEYLKKYLFDWEMTNIVIAGRSSLDSSSFLGRLASEDAIHSFLKAYGVDQADPINRAELFGNFQEAMQFIRRYFLKEGNNEEGLDIKIPNTILMITDITDLFRISIRQKGAPETEERLWAEIILKVMHTILHVDKDLRSNYFTYVQTQIFDRFYKHIHREENGELFLGDSSNPRFIKLVEFETKAKKTRESVIIKLLHKAENVAEELFDRVGVRFVTNDKLDCVRVVKFMLDKSIIVPHNIKPSRSLNSLINMKKFKEAHFKEVKNALKNNLSEEAFLENLSRSVGTIDDSLDVSKKNPYSSNEYKAIQFTCRQLIRYKNPLFKEIADLRKLAKKQPDSEISQRLLNLDIGLVSRDIRFFYPYEVQIVDSQTHLSNSQGVASHQEYKKAQVLSAKSRLFGRLLDFIQRSQVINK